MYRERTQSYNRYWKLRVTLPTYKGTLCRRFWAPTQSKEIESIVHIASFSICGRLNDSLSRVCQQCALAYENNMYKAHEKTCTVRKREEVTKIILRRVCFFYFFAVYVVIRQLYWVTIPKRRYQVIALWFCRIEPQSYFLGIIRDAVWCAQ